MWSVFEIISIAKTQDFAKAFSFWKGWAVANLNSNLEHYFRDRPPNCRVRFESRVDIATVPNMINMWFSWPQWLTVAHILLTYCIHSCEVCPLSGVLAESGWFKSHCPQIHPHNCPHNHPRHSPIRKWLSYVLELIYQRIQRGPRSDASIIFNLEDLWKIQK